MASFLQKNSDELNQINSTISTPDDNDVARLMYYLHCVCIAIRCDQISEIQRFTHYTDWASLSIDDQKVLLALCYTFSPDLLDDNVFFHSETLSNDHMNEFYDISQVRHQLLTAESIVIAGQTHEVKNVMIYTMQWLEKYYIDPMPRLVQKIHSELHCSTSVLKLPPSPVYTSTPLSILSASPTTKSSYTKGCTLGLLCCFLIILVVIIAIVVFVVNNN